MLKRSLVSVMFIAVYFLSIGISRVSGRDLFVCGEETTCEQGCAKIASVGNLPTKGYIRALAISVKFTGEFPDITSPPSYSEDIFNIDLPGSFSHFYHEMSCGQLKVDGEVLEKLYVSDHPPSYYINGYDLAYGQAVREILEKVDSDVDFGSFDNDGPDGIPNSGDDDGYVDVVFVNFLRVPSGFIPFGEALGIADLGLGSADFISSDTGASGDRIEITLGTVQESASFPRLVGAMCHEFGHLLGLGDLYNLNSEELPEKDLAGTGAWGIMGHGAWGWNGNDGPNPFCAYSLEKLGWIGVDNERLEVVTQSGNVSILPTFQGGEVYKIPLSDDEYYLISNRDRSVSYYDRNIPGSGLLIWHITGSSHLCRNIDLECADGRYRDAGYPLGKEPDPVNGEDNLDFWAHDEMYRTAHGGNTGDSTDPFDGTRFTSFSESTNPSSKWERSTQFLQDHQSWKLVVSDMSIDGIHGENGTISAFITIPQGIEVFDYVFERYEKLKKWVSLDNSAEPGDLLRLKFRIKNWTDLLHTSLSATVSTDDPFVNPGNSFQPVILNLGRVLPGEIKEAMSQHWDLTEFIVASDTPSEHDIDFHICMGSDGFEWRDSLIVHIAGTDMTPPDIITYWIDKDVGVGDSLAIACSVRDGGPVDVKAMIKAGLGDSVVSEIFLVKDPSWKGSPGEYLYRGCWKPEAVSDFKIYVSAVDISGNQSETLIGNLISVSQTTDKSSEWMNFTSNINIQALADDREYLWIGTEGGLIKLNKATGEMAFCNRGNSGLPDNSIKALAVDGQGDLWIGTENGLVRFDESYWIVYKSSNSELLSNQITSLAVDGQGDVWIGTQYGLAKFDGVDWTVYKTSNSELPDNNINTLLVDEQQNIWVGVGGYPGVGLAKFDGVNWMTYNMSNSGLPSDRVSSLAVDGWNNIWIGTNSGLTKFDGENWTVYNQSSTGLPSNNVSSLAADMKGDIWIGTYYDGLAKFDGESWTVYDKDNSGLLGDDVSAVAVDSQDNIWIGNNRGSWAQFERESWTGLAKFDGESWTAYEISNPSLSSNRVWSLAVDGQGNVWMGIGSSYGCGFGLAKFDGINWTMYNETTSGVPINSASSLVIDGWDNVWIGTTVEYGGHLTMFGSALVKFDGTDDWTVYEASESGLPGNIVNALAIDRQWNIWIGAVERDQWSSLQGAGLAKFDGESWKVHNESNSSLPSDWVNSLAVDGCNNIWIGTDSGLAKFDELDWAVYDRSNSDLPSNNIPRLAIDGRENVWIGTDGSGLARFDGESWKVYDESNSGLPSNWINSLAVDGCNNIWIGAVERVQGSLQGAGLVKFDGENWTVYKKSNSRLPDDRVNTLTIDKWNNIWVGTDSGGLAVYREGGVVLSPATAVGEHLTANLPSAVSLFQNYPNPFNATTKISFNIAKRSHVKIAIYNVIGQLVCELIGETYAPCILHVRWDGKD